MDFLERLRQLIDVQKIKKTQLIKDLDLARGTLYNYLNGETSPTEEEVKEMTKKLDKLYPETKPKRNDELYVDTLKKLVTSHEEMISELKQDKAYFQKRFDDLLDSKLRP